MTETRDESKQKWDPKNFKQIKVLVTPSVAAAFKAACIESEQSVNKVLSTYMESAFNKKMPKTVRPLLVATRPQRRKTLQFILIKLQELYEAECSYNENIPENLRGGERFEQSQHSIETLEEAITLLDDVF